MSGETGLPQGLPLASGLWPGLWLTGEGTWGRLHSVRVPSSSGKPPAPLLALGPSHPPRPEAGPLGGRHHPMGRSDCTGTKTQPRPVFSPGSLPAEETRSLPGPPRLTR